ncbi:MAG: hypothetical protein ACYDHF_03985 [Candidatus Cryosericum sp.]
MRTWIVVILVAAGLGLGCSAALARTPSAGVSTSGLPEEAMDIGETKFAAELRELGIEVEPGEATTAISRNAAVEVATKYEGERISHEAQAITTVYGGFSDHSTSSGDAPIMLPGTNRVMNNVPVWIVTFHGVHMLHSGPCMIDTGGKEIPSTRDPYIFGDANVVLDAETGEVLEGFNYNTPEAASIGIATTLPSWNGTSLCDMAVRWATLCGDEHPTDIRFVETTRQKAAKLLDGATVDSDNACYAVVLRGNFVDTRAFTPDGRSMYGTTMTFVVRGSDGTMTDSGLNDLFYPDLDTLGTVKTIVP